MTLSSAEKRANARTRALAWAAVLVAIVVVRSSLEEKELPPDPQPHLDKAPSGPIGIAGINGTDGKILCVDEEGYRYRCQ